MKSIFAFCAGLLAVAFGISSARSAPPAATGAALDFWSLRAVAAPAVPHLSGADAAWSRNAIDAFVLEGLHRHGLAPSPEADRRTLIRRLFFDLTGLPPAPEEVAGFVADESPDAYERLVDQLLASPRYGERWARHWLDLVHYGDTHGYDKDKPRPNAWPYRDYVIRAFNENKPFRQFVLEQVAGDVLFPDSRDGIEATGFISAGPWDFIGHAEVPETKIDGQIARSLDRDDMVANTMNTFASLTVQCARCHDHKFDPITQQDYYSLQAVFAALDRADRAYDIDPAIARQRRALRERQRTLRLRAQDLTNAVGAIARTELGALDQRIVRLKKGSPAEGHSAFGYHSQIAAKPDELKWVQVDLGRSVAIDQIRFAGCRDSFNGIGDGFGFPVRFKIEVCAEPDFKSAPLVVLNRLEQDVANPGVVPQALSVAGAVARYVRCTATRLAPRQNDYIFALAELMVLDAAGNDLALGRPVTALDSIEAPPRWTQQNLVDGFYPGNDVAGDPKAELAQTVADREATLVRFMDETQKRAWTGLQQDLTNLQAQLATLPRESLVYAGTVFSGSGAFAGTGGKPRVIRVLARGDVGSPREVAQAGTVPLIPGLPARFDVAADAPEGERRAALARWLVHPQNPLTWRSIVNRVWQHHLGRGLVATANDFGRMGEKPTHPELLDWLATEFRAGGGSLKNLHRLIVTSATYRQSSADDARAAAVDEGNQYYWRMNRRRLEAEEIRDTVLTVAEQLDSRMTGPGFEDFVIEKPEHSPHYQYHLHDPNDPRSHRRSIYRFLVRSQQSPFMTTLDCADPSQLVPKRNETLTALQALALLNNKLILAMSKQFAQRLAREQPDLAGQIDTAYRLALGRRPSVREVKELSSFARSDGLANACRLILNLNEFVFID